MKNQTDRIEDKSEFLTSQGRLTEVIGYDDNQTFLGLSLPCGAEIEIAFLDFCSGSPNPTEPSEVWQVGDEILEKQMLQQCETLEHLDGEDPQFETESWTLVELTKLRSAYRQARNK